MSFSQIRSEEGGIVPLPSKDARDISNPDYPWMPFSYHEYSIWDFQYRKTCIDIEPDALQRVKRVGTAIGDLILDLSVLERYGLLDDCFEGKIPLKDSELRQLLLSKTFFSQSTLNTFASLCSTTRTSVRSKIITLLQSPDSLLYTDSNINNAAFHRQNEAQMYLPMQIGDFTDFMCSRVHVDNCSRIANTSTPLSFHAMPSAYNGRSSSIVVSGTPIQRPRGMLHSPSLSSQAFSFLPSARMDFELELGFFISTPVPLGKIIKTADEAKDHIFGFVLLNDWSARDIQFAEMRPLGPFNGKGSASTISPWVVTLDALAGSETLISDSEAITGMSKRPSHLRHMSEKQTWDIEVGVALKRNGNAKPATISLANLKDLYWSPAQMLSHHASSGCGFRTGDLLGTGTISSQNSERETPRESSFGCLLEITEGGKKGLMLGDEEVMWLEDSDEVVMSGKVIRSDGSVIGFGECSGLIEPVGDE